MGQKHRNNRQKFIIRKVKLFYFELMKLFLFKVIEVLVRRLSSSDILFKLKRHLVLSYIFKGLEASLRFAQSFITRISLVLDIDKCFQKFNINCIFHEFWLVLCVAIPTPQPAYLLFHLNTLVFVSSEFWITEFFTLMTYSCRQFSLI